MRPLVGIVIHCPAVRPIWMASRPLSTKIAEIRRWHVRDRGWSDIGYHRLIDRDGTRGNGRPIARVGSHVMGHNTGTIGVCLIGGWDSSADDEFLTNFTIQQCNALKQEIADLRAAYGPLWVKGHNQLAQKACPGFRVAKWMADAGVKP